MVDINKGISDTEKKLGRELTDKEKELVNSLGSLFNLAVDSHLNEGTCERCCNYGTDAKIKEQITNAKTDFWLIEGLSDEERNELRKNALSEARSYLEKQKQKAEIV